MRNVPIDERDIQFCSGCGQRMKRSFAEDAASQQVCIPAAFHENVDPLPKTPEAKKRWKNVSKVNDRAFGRGKKEWSDGKDAGLRRE
jgi:hypothetical protein